MSELTLSQAVDFLDECAEADANLENTAVNLAEAVKEIYEDVEMVDSTTEGIVNFIAPIDSAVNVGAQIPVPPASDLKPVHTTLSNVKKVLRNVKKKLDPVVNSLKLIYDVTQLITNIAEAGMLSANPDTSRLTKDSSSVTKQLISKFPDGLPKSLEDEAKKIIAATERVKPILDKPLHEVDDILVGLHKLSPLMNITAELKPIHDTLKPVSDSFSNYSKQFNQFTKPFQKALNRIADASWYALHKVEGKVKEAINKLLKKMGLKVDIFKTFDRELHKIELTFQHALLEPVENVTSKIKRVLDNESESVIEAVHHYIDTRKVIDAALAPLDKLLETYIEEAGKHGVYPK